MNDNLKIFSGSANPELCEQISSYLQIPMGICNIDSFPDGELLVKLEDDVRGRDVFVVQSTCPPVSQNVMELLVFLDCVRRASAKRVTAVIPYFGYARQDRKAEGRTPITAKLVANLITTAGADRVLTMDLHSDQIQGFFDIPLDHLFAEPVLTSHYKHMDLGQLVVVSPDPGNVKIAGDYASRLGADLAFLDKRRLNGTTAIQTSIVGDVGGKNVLMVDDMISTAGTICGAAKLLKAKGAKKIFVGATHAVFCGEAFERISTSPIENVTVTNTIPMNGNTCANLVGMQVLSVAELLGEAIHRIHKNQSVSSLFK